MWVKVVMLLDACKTGVSTGLLVLSIDLSKLSDFQVCRRYKEDADEL